MSALIVIVLKIIIHIALFVLARDGIVNQTIRLQTSPSHTSNIGPIRYMYISGMRAFVLGITLGLLSLLLGVVFWLPLNDVLESSWFVIYEVAFASVLVLALGIMFYSAYEMLVGKRT